MTSHSAWLSRRAQSSQSSPEDTGKRGLLFGVAWYRYVLASLSITVGLGVGWMLVTRQWSVWDRPSLDYSGTPEEQLAHVFALFCTTCAPFFVGGFVKLLFDSELAGILVGGALLVLMVSNLLSPALGGLLMSLGLLGAVAALIGDLAEAGSEEPTAPQSVAAPQEHETDEVSLQTLAGLIGASSADLTASMREHLTAIHAAADSALPRLRRASRLGDEELPTPELLTMLGAVERHVPETIRNYLSLPREFRTAKLADGRTVVASTEDQLALMRQELEALLRTSLQSELRAVAVQDAFVGARFPATSALAEESRT